MNIPRVDPKNVAGLADKVVGLGKEIVGSLSGQEQLAKAGRIQQQKGTERLKTVRSEADAKAHDAKAAAADTAQRRATVAKEKVNG